MVKKLLCKMLAAIISFGLIGCSHVEPTAVNSAEVISSSAATSNPGLCTRSLKIANYNLEFAKQQAKNAHVFTDWGLANKALAAAQNAYQAQDYNQCVEQAKLVNTYIERSQSYIKWRHSQNL